MMDGYGLSSKRCPFGGVGADHSSPGFCFEKCALYTGRDCAFADIAYSLRGLDRDGIEIYLPDPDLRAIFKQMAVSLEEIAFDLDRKKEK